MEGSRDLHACELSIQLIVCEGTFDSFLPSNLSTRPYLTVPLSPDCTSALALQQIVENNTTQNLSVLEYSKEVSWI